MGRNILFVFILLVGLLSCTRPEANKTKFTLSLPTGINGSFASTLPNSVHLGHVVINISGAGMNPVVFNWDGDKGGNPPAEFTFELSQGTGRLVQVLEVFVDDSDQSMLFYYGDATLDFNSATITANIPITKINQTTTISGQVMGRYFTTATGGPTGPVNTTYAPPGKPDMIIETSFIYDGWFSFMGMTDVEFTYRMADGTKIFGGPVKLSNAMFESSNRVFKVAVPVNSYSYMMNGLTQLKNEGAELFIWGWFGDTTLAAMSTNLATKRVCTSTAAGLTFSGDTEKNKYSNSSTKLYYNAVADEASFPSIADLTNTTTPLNYVAFLGGVPDSDSPCAGNTYVNAFTVSNMNLKNGKEQAAPFRGPLMIQNLTSNEAFIDGSPGHRLGKLVPNFAATQVVAYIIDPATATALSNQGSEFNCINPPASQGVMTADINASTRVFDLNFIGYAAYFPNTGTTSSLGICFKNGSVTYARGMFKYNGSSGGGSSSSSGSSSSGGSTSSSSGGGGGTPTQLSIESNPAMGSVKCKKVRVNTLNSSNGIASVFAAVSVNLTGTGGSTFYSSNDFCSGTPINSISIPASMASAEVYVNSASTGPFTITATDASGTLTAASKAIQIRAAGNLTDLFFEAESLSNPNYCKMIKINAKDPENNLIGGFTGTLNFQMSDFANNTGTTFYSTVGCTGGSELTPPYSVNFTSGSAYIYMKSTNTGENGLSASVTDGGLTFNFMLGFKVVPLNQATRLTHTMNNNNVTSLYAGDCIPYTVQAVNDAGTSIAGTYGGTLDVQSYLQSNNWGRSFYPNSSCTGSGLGGLDSNGSGNFWMQFNRNSTSDNFVDFKMSVRLNDPGVFNTNYHLNTQDTTQYRTFLKWIVLVYDNAYAAGATQNLAVATNCIPLHVSTSMISSGINSPSSNLTGASINLEIKIQSMPSPGSEGSLPIEVYGENTCTATPVWTNANPNNFLNLSISNASSTSGGLFLKTTNVSTSVPAFIVIHSINNLNYGGAWSNGFNINLNN